MNTHDIDIELPPLPTSFVLGYAQGTIEDIENYARAAIEADRKRHDRMLAHEWIRPALDLPENAPYRFDYYAQEIERLRNDRKRRDEEQEPFGYFRPEPFGWTDCAATDEGAIALYERPQAQGEPVGWQPIETAPHDEEVLLGWLEWDGAWKMEVSQASWGWSTKTASNISRHGQATHWMPLPDAPQPTEPVKEQP